jgi:hypothetical protein
VALEAPVRWRRDRPPSAASRAREAAVASLSTARTERDRQKGLADTEHHEVVAPLRRMREQNHLAELFIGTLERGRRRDSGPPAG